MIHSPDISVILPAFNEEENLVSLLDELHQALKSLNKTYEILVVDDASNDNTLQRLTTLQKEDSSLRILQHQRRCGQSAAYASGFREARGEFYLTLDSDCQHDPADIPSFWQAMQEGVDCVAGYREKRQDSALKKRASRWANAFRDALTGVKVCDAGCTFRLFRAEVTNELPVFNGLHRFFVTLLKYQGFSVVEIPIHHRPRLKGDSKYGVHDRLWRGLRDCFAMRWFRRRVVPARRYKSIGESHDR